MPCKKNPQGKTYDASWIRKVLEHRPVSTISDEERNLMIKLSEDAFVEFERGGQVSTIRCHVCNGLIEIRELSPTAWEQSCTCGKYKCTMKGL